MDMLETNSQVGVRTDAFWKKLDSLIDNSWGPPQPPPWKSQGGAAQAARSLELRAALSLGQHWLIQGKAGSAKKLVSEIFSKFTEGFDTPDLRRAVEFIQANKHSENDHPQNVG